MVAEKFTLEPKLLLVCRICDDSGTELEFADYKTKGTTLKLVTEEVQQEVTKKGKRYYTFANDPNVYWDPSVLERQIVAPGPLYNNYNMTPAAYKLAREVFYAANPDHPLNEPFLAPNINTVGDILLKMETKFKGGADQSLIKDVSSTYSGLIHFDWKDTKSYVRGDVVVRYNSAYVANKATTGEDPKINNSTDGTKSWTLYGKGHWATFPPNPGTSILINEDVDDHIKTVIYKDTNDKTDTVSAFVFDKVSYPKVAEDNLNSVVANDVFRETTRTPIIDPITFAITGYNISPKANSNVRYTNIVVADNFQTFDKFEEDPYVELSKKEDTRHFQVYESYAKKIPSRVYKVSFKDGLDKAVNMLINDPTMKKYDKLKKLIIDNNVTPELRYFNDSNYNIHEETFQKLFDRFKDVTIQNNLLTITFPSGDLKLDKLKLKDCGVLSNNTVVSVAGGFDLENCKFNTSSKAGKLKTISFKVKGDVDVKAVKIVGMTKITIMVDNSDPKSQFKGKVGNIVFDFAYKNDDVRKSTPIVNILGFNELTIHDVSKTLTCEVKNFVLFKIDKCTKVTLMDIDTCIKQYTYPLFAIDGATTLKISNFTDKSKNAKGSCMTLANMKPEAKITFNDCTIDGDNLFTLTKCEIGDFDVNNSTFTLNKLFKYIKTEPFSRINIASTSTINMNGNIDLKIKEMSLDNSTFNCDSGVFNVGAKLSFKDAHLKVKDSFKIAITNKSGNVSFSNSPIWCGKDFKVHSKGVDDSSRIEFTSSIVNAKTFETGSVQTLNFQFSPIESNYTMFDTVGELKSSKSPIRIDKARTLEMYNIISMGAAEFNIEKSGSFKIITTSVNGNLTFNITDGSVKLNKVSKDSNIVETYKYADKAFNIIVLSNNCVPSAYVIDDNKSFLVSPLSKDFKTFDILDPITFSNSGVVNKTYENIFYGQVV